VSEAFLRRAEKELLVLIPIVMVDQMMVWTHAKHRCFKDGSCHLTVNGELFEHLEALHAVAKRIGLSREWFQDKRIPHYDLTANMRIEALKAGAVEVDAYEQARDRIQRRRSLVFPDDGDFERAGDIPCLKCGRLYGYHPAASNIVTMHRICDGAWVREGLPDIVWVKL